MKNKIQTFKLFIRPGEKSQQVAEKFKHFNFKQAKPLIESENADLVVAIGGDGTFIHAVTQTHFSKEVVYTGIHTGTLGFLQDLSEDDIPMLFKHISGAESLKTREVFIALVEVFLKDGSTYQRFALNDALIAGENYTKISFAEYINGKLLQNITGCGINIATSTGDTGFSLNSNGAIDFSSNFQLVCTLENAITNATTERFIANPIICSKINIVLKPADNICIKIDGQKQDIDSRLIKRVEVSMIDASYYINKLDLKNYSKVDVTRAKILGLPAVEQK